MKKRLMVVLVISVVLCLVLTGPAFAENKVIVLKIGDPSMAVNGKSQEIDQGRGTKPVVIQGRTCLPIRAVIEAIGGTISWTDATQEITMKANNKTIKMTIGVKTAYIQEIGTQESVAKALDVAPSTINGRTMVPVRFVAENLGAVVGWDEPTQTVTLTFAGSPAITPVDAGSWIAVWQTDQGDITLVQEGVNIISLPFTAKWGKITATVFGNQLIGRWYIDVTHQGQVELTMAADGKAFKGRWNNDPPENPFASNPQYPDMGWTKLNGQRK